MEFRVPKTPFAAADQYVVREQIGAGGMGTVYRAFDVQLRRDVALKVLNRLDNDSLERFVREREITADLDHPNFVRILSMGYLETGEGRRPFYTMPLLRGETLAAMIRRRARADDEGERLREEFTQRRLVQLVQQLCLALESAHARGIVHRDLKPANIIMGPYGETYIVDLGLAKYIQGDEAEPAPGKGRADKDEEADQELTAQAPAGTPFYSAPEQILDPASIDARTDVFGLGAILYYILTGHHPLYRPPTAMRRTFSDVGPDRIRTDAPTTVNESDGFLKKPPFPQWSEAQDAPSSSKSEVVVRALHGVLIPPDEVAAQRRPEPEGAAEEEVRGESVEPALAAICVKALARKASERFASCRAMWRELQQYLEGQTELLFKREAADLTRTMSRRTVPQALRDYELAEGRLRQRIVQKENVGRLGIEEKLDLFDLLLEKAKIYERRGDSGSIVRSVMRAEPIIESTLEVLNRQFIQLLIARGAAQEAQRDFAGAKAIISKAISLAQAHKFEDLLASACGAFGVACAGSSNSRELEAGRAALADSIKFADRAGEVPQGVRSRIGLARLQLRSGGDPARAQSRLEEALRLSGEDSVLLAETWTALGEFHLARRDAFRAVDHLTSAIKHAQEADAQNLVREAHFLLGQARHAQGDGAGRDEHFKQALQVRGPRRTDMERRIAAFLERQSGEARHAAPALKGSGAHPSGPARAGRKSEAKVK